jgi:hypothetical protein
MPKKIYTFPITFPLLVQIYEDLLVFNENISYFMGILKIWDPL